MRHNTNHRDGVANSKIRKAVGRITLGRLKGVALKRVASKAVRRASKVSVRDF
mgnify:CR=1 FL=1|jgi:hypothetical protein